MVCFFGLLQQAFNVAAVVHTVDADDASRGVNQRHDLAVELLLVAKDGVFLSQAELRDRAKVPRTVVETMARLGILGDMPEEGQLSFSFLFDNNDDDQS